MGRRLLPGSDLRLRRSRRRDLDAIQALLGPGAPLLGPRYGRRLLTDLRVDVYVVDNGGGVLVGVIAVAYVRSLARGGMTALLDLVRVTVEPPRPLLERLVASAEERASRRGCRALEARVDPGDAMLREVLGTRGYAGAERLVLALAGDA